jgi:hypothetical protein
MKLDNSMMDKILNEYNEATSKFYAFNSAHEGYAVILEELDELWDAVRMGRDEIDEKGRTRKQALQDEAIQVGAMAIRFLVDICEEE